MKPILNHLDLIDSIPDVGQHNFLNQIKFHAEEVTNLYNEIAKELHFDANTNSNLMSLLTKHQQEYRWKLITKVDPEESHFILGMPLYNEEELCESCISIVNTLSDIPLSANVWHIYITNCCTDKTVSIVECNFFSGQLA